MLEAVTVNLNEKPIDEALKVVPSVGHVLETDALTDLHVSVARLEASAAPEVLLMEPVNFA